ncbi:MAG: SH3 domain-containing protein [Kurthia sp.]|nr:SH3 domain-containing protein [Candidatus Kurthia equi]
MLNKSMKKLFPESFKNSKSVLFFTTFTLMIAFVVATIFSTTANEQASKNEAKEVASKSYNYANRFANESIQTVAAKKYKTTASLNLRKGAGTKYKKILAIPKGKSVTYISKKGSWYKVSYKGKKGYVSSKYLKSTKKVSNAGRSFYVTSTAYTAYCSGCSGRTATGINLRANPSKKVIAVDPRVIPLGSKVYVQGYGTAIAGDTGGAIRGNRIDVFKSSKKAALNWGRRTVKITIL